MEQQPRSRTTSRSRGHSARVTPNDVRPRPATRAATTLESTPPDIATATTAVAGSRSSGSSGMNGAAPGHRGNDGELVTLADRCVEALAEADVGVIDVDVDELAQVAGVVVEALTKPRVRAVEAGQRLRHRRPLHTDLGIAAGE